MNPFDPELQEKITRCGVIAVLVIEKVEDAVPVAEALFEGGVHVMELTLRTDAALEALSTIREKVPEMIAGVGTILTPEQVERVAERDAAFGVSPGFNPRVVKAAKESGLSFAPGICTPSDVEGALEYGCRLLKYFPAESSGGIKNLVNMAAPYLHLGVQFIPLGGLNLNNVEDYLSTKLVPAVGGSWLAKSEQIRARDWAGIRNNAEVASQLIKRIRT